LPYGGLPRRWSQVAHALLLFRRLFAIAPM
jgi:hypothetical protein